MYPVKIQWTHPSEGGRKSIPGEGGYYCVARFAEDVAWQNNAWSVVFELGKKKVDGEVIISFGTVRFLMDTAPKELMGKIIFLRYMKVQKKWLLYYYSMIKCQMVWNVTS